MLVALNDAGELIEANRALPGRYTCPICNRPVVLKKGKVKLPHFAHQTLKDCFMYTYKKETVAHIEGKYALYDLFDPSTCFMEYYLSSIEQIPDCYHTSSIAFELQMSVIPVSHIVTRTSGYNSIGVEVIWIAKFEDIKINDTQMKLTHFQKSLIHLASNVLFAYHTQLKSFFALQIIRVLNHNEFEIKIIRIINGEAILSIITDNQLMLTHRVLSKIETKKHIQNCLAKKSVLQPTLSGLYQLRIDHRNIPEYLRIVIPEQIYIDKHPIEWQVELMVMIHNQQFDFEKWMNCLKLSEQSNLLISQPELALHILKVYQHISNQMRALITEK